MIIGAFVLPSPKSLRVEVNDACKGRGPGFVWRNHARPGIPCPARAASARYVQTVRISDTGPLQSRPDDVLLPVGPRMRVWIFPFHVRLSAWTPSARSFRTGRKRASNHGFRDGKSAADPGWLDKFQKWPPASDPRLPCTISCCRAFVIRSPGNPLSSVLALVGVFRAQGWLA